jgi:1-acyl-sn-glycerol-3-phosphate acyltransferase
VRGLRSLGVWIVIVIATIVFGLPAIPIGLMPPRGRWLYHWARWWSRILLTAAGARVRVIHPERLARDRAFVVAPNHSSFFDIPVLFSTMPRAIGFLAKRTLFRLPFMGWAMAAAGFVPVDRGERGRTVATIDAALRRLERGRWLVVFPEETRTRTGDLLPFKAGAALLAIRSGRPILPVGIVGTLGIERRGEFTITPSRVAVAIGEPIEVDGRTAADRAEITSRLREAVAALRAEAQASLDDSGAAR